MPLKISNPELTGVKFGWTQDDVPKDLREDLEVNPHLFQRYVDAVKKAVLESLRDRRTSPLLLTQQAIKERVTNVHKTLLTCRQEMGLSLRRCLDILPERYMNALLRGQRPEDLVEKSETNPTAWGKTVKEEVPLRDLLEAQQVIRTEGAGMEDMSEAAEAAPDVEMPDQGELPDDWKGEILLDDTD